MATKTIGLDANIVTSLRLGDNSTDDINGVTEDCSIRGGAYADQNQNAASTDLMVRWSFSANDRRKFFIRFDLSGISPYTRVASASLNLYQWQNRAIPDLVIWFCDRDWTETLMTWNNYDGSNPWGADHDARGSPFHTYACNTVTGYKEVCSSQALLNYIQDCIDGLDGSPTGTASFVFYKATSLGTYTNYHKRENADGVRPYLELTLEEPQVPVGLDAAISAVFFKSVGLDGSVGHYGRYADLDASVVEGAERVTQHGHQIAYTGSPVAMVTQHGRQVAYLSELPNRPYITSVADITSGTALVSSSPYAHPALEPHAGTRYQVQFASGDWTSLVYDSGTLGAVESATIHGTVALSPYQVRVAYMDDEGDWSDWSHPYFFMSGQTAVTVGAFDWGDWAQMWNIGDAYYYGSYIGPGGWSGPLSWAAWQAGGDCGGVPYIDAGFEGHVGSFGRLLGPPSVLANTDLGPNTGVNVAGKVSWHSGQGGFSWERWWDCEFARAGVAALVCGTCEPVDPALGWNLWYPYTPGGWPCTDDMQGVVAYIDPGFSFPYVPCVCWSGGSIAEQANWLLMTCYHYGMALSSNFIVDIWLDGDRVKRYSYALPWKVVFNQLWAQCREQTYGGDYWACRHFPKYGIRLKVEKDLGTDPEGKTHTIQASVATPTTTYHGGSGDPIHVQVEGYWGLGDALLPPEDGPWDIDEVWVGGHDESGPGAGDGGLYCGWTGWMSDRWTGGAFDKTSGGNIYLDFTAQVLSTAECDTPCDADYKTPIPIPEPEPEPLQPAPFRPPCPPDMETADKELYLGGSASPGALFRFGGYEVEEGRQITARIRPNPVAPMGYGGECIFDRLVVTLEHYSDIHISVVPILNGERLDRYAQEEVFVGPGDRAQLRRYEVPLYRAFEDLVVEGADDDRFKHGLRGVNFTFDMTIVDLCGIGLQLPGVWLEYRAVRESQGTGVIYTEDLVRLPAFVPSGQTFLGTKGYNRLLKAASGVTDDGVQVEAKVFSNPVAPEGAAGECEFRRVSLVVTRWNANDMTVKVTPWIDGVNWPPIEVSYKATTAPVTEVTELDLATYYRRLGADAIERFRYRKRGAWFHLEVQTGSGLQEWLSIEGADIEYDVVRESLQKDVR